MNISEGQSIGEAIQEDKELQWEDISYSVECNICGLTITGVLLERDFERPQQRTWHKIIAHNMVHYEEPAIYNCEEDDIFGVTHHRCTHR